MPEPNQNPRKRRNRRGFGRDWEETRCFLEAAIVESFRKGQTVVKAGRKFPTETQFREMGLGRVASEITIFHGGFRRVREEFGFEQAQVKPGFWWDWSNVERMLKEEKAKEYRDSENKVIKEAGVLPSDPQLRQMGLNSLSRAIYDYHGGMAEVRKRFGAELQRRPDGWWKDWGVIETEVRAEIAKEYKDNENRVIKRAGEFPTQKQLADAGCSDLIGGVMRHGGLTKAKERLGFAPSHKPKGYWDDWNNLERELKAEIDRQYVATNGSVVKKAGVFPTQKQLEREDRTDLNSAIQLHGGFDAVRARFGLKPLQTPDRYWKDPAKFTAEIRKEIEKEYVDERGTVFKRAGEFPADSQLKAAGRSDLVNAIRKYHGGFNKVRMQFGFPVEQIKPKGYWDDPSNLKRELKAEIEKEYCDKDGTVLKKAGETPSLDQLKNAGCTALKAAIKSNGGLRRICYSLGLGAPPVNIKHNRAKFESHWKNWRLFEAEMRKEIAKEYMDKEGAVFKKAGEFPSSNVLKKIGRKDLAFAIQKHGGFNEICERFGMPSPQASGFWAVWDNVERELRVEIAKEYRNKEGAVSKKAGEFPTRDQLCKAGRSTLASTISNYGGTHEVRRRLGFGQLERPKNYWKSWENLERELRAEIARKYTDKEGKVVKKAGEFPTSYQLKEQGLNALPSAIEEHGGFVEIRRRMGFAPVRMESGHWKSWDNVERTLRGEIAKEYKDNEGRIIKKAGEFPTTTHLKHARLTSLVAAIHDFHGGFSAAKARMGFDASGPNDVEDAKAQIESLLSRLESQDQSE